jgi:uncharacterized alpha-E superfamily protein
MIMLSRVARRIYWLARYMERAENTARLVNTYHFLLLDLPRGTRVSWELLPVIIGRHALFEDYYQRHDERNTVKFLLADAFNSGSLMNSVAAVRENCRTSREVLPGQAWEEINELYHFTHSHVDEALIRRGRFDFLNEIIQRCQQITGLLSGTMSHDHAYEFLRIGRNLERADMTTRVIDIGAMSMVQSEEPSSLDDHIWTSLLRSLNVYQMYRKDVQLGVHYADVIAYLLQNGYLPRSVSFCLNQVEESFVALPEYKEPLRQIRQLQRDLGSIKPKRLGAQSIHNKLDKLQIGISGIHEEIRKAWFE